MRPEVNMTALGANLSSARRQQHLRQADLAREVGMHAVTLSRIEHGKLPGVTMAVLDRFAMRLDLSLDHLLQWQPGPPLHHPLDHAPLDPGETARTVQDGGLARLESVLRRHALA